MFKDRTDRIKPHNWILMPVMVAFAALYPEYIAPGFTIFSCIMSMWKPGIKKQKLSNFTLGYAVIVLMVWMIIGAFYADSFTSPLFILLLWAMNFSNIWVSTLWVDTEDKLHKIIKAGAFAAGVVGFIAVLQWILRLIFGAEETTIINPLWHCIDLGIEKLIEILPESLSASMPRKTFKLFPERSSGTFSNPLFLATFLVAMISFCFYCFLNGKTKREKIFGFVTLLFAIGGIVSSFSRGPYIYAVIVFGLLIVLNGKKAIKKVLGVASVGGLIVLICSKSIVARLLTLVSAEDKSVNTRKRIWTAVFEKIPQKFVFGYGTGVDSVRDILHDEYKINQPHAHNIFLEFQMENGIIGVLLFIGILLLFAYNAFKLYKKGGIARSFGITFFVSIVGMCLCGMTDCIFYGLKPLQYFMLVLGLTQAAVNIYLKGDEKPLAKLEKRLDKLKKKSRKTEEEKDKIRV